MRADHGGRCFDAVPGLVQRLMAEPGEPRIVLVWIDAFGWRFAERHADHPWLRRVAESGTIEQWTSQFPSTTTAHFVTLHSTLPVAEHGMYEWFVYEPSLDRMICPLKYSFAGDHEPRHARRRARLARRPVPAGDAPAGRDGQQGTELPRVPERDYTPGVATDLALMGAAVHPFADPAAGLEEPRRRDGAAGSAVRLRLHRHRRHRRPRHGPRLAAVRRRDDRAAGRARAAVPGARDARLVVTADHGRPPSIRRPRSTSTARGPASPTTCGAAPMEGCSRRAARRATCSSTSKPGSSTSWWSGSRRWWGDAPRCMPRRSSSHDGVFGPAPSARLRSRIGNVLMLPRRGRDGVVVRGGPLRADVHGHHGGASADEMLIPLITLPIG